ncbi:YdcF family protein [Allopusillimonas soli]|uniref:YdcF family protein n=1 Tax=Allopusillimonas soli TaxID=659016 RepID=A0A853FFL5_9BURK|nr:YdcF family protein [Allopusillimonas soli]NYT38472.1 YdcF family protein [Allopusillimonas soli]TEA71974.1 YdcF family protein [Allopusillimonas soli]
MNLSSFLTNLVIPANLCAVMLVAGMLLFIARLRKTGLAIACTGIAWAVFWSLPASSLWAGGRLEQLYAPTPAAMLPHAQAIVVLGGSTANSRKNWFQPYDDDTAVSRVETANMLYHQGLAPKVVLSGAALDGNVSEAEMMARFLRRHDVPENAILLETQSYTTHENGVYTARLLRNEHIGHILLVTSPLHMPRAMAVFRKLGVDATAAPSPPQIVVPDSPGFSFWVPSMRALSASRSIVKEYVALVVYWIRGWI